MELEDLENPDLTISNEDKTVTISSSSTAAINCIAVIV